MLIYQFTMWIIAATQCPPRVYPLSAWWSRHYSRWCDLADHPPPCFHTGIDQITGGDRCLRMRLSSVYLDWTMQWSILGMYTFSTDWYLAHLFSSPLMCCLISECILVQEFGKVKAALITHTECDLPLRYIFVSLYTLKISLTMQYLCGTVS